MVLEILQILLHRSYKLMCQQSPDMIQISIYYLVEVPPITFIANNQQSHSISHQFINFL